MWVGYFDEGVYRDYGWRHRGPKPVGMHGIVKFGPSLNELWHHSFDLDWGAVDDCYALNVSGETVWSCYYSDFPVVRIGTDGHVTGWRNTVGGARVLLVGTDGDWVALVAGYQENRWRIVDGQLEDRQLTTGAFYELTMPDSRLYSVRPA